MPRHLNIGIKIVTICDDSVYIFQEKQAGFASFRISVTYRESADLIDNKHGRFRSALKNLKRTNNGRTRWVRGLGEAIPNEITPVIANICEFDQTIEHQVTVREHLLNIEPGLHVGMG